MKVLSSSILFSLVLAFSLALVSWWTWFQVREAGELRRAGELLAAGQTQAAARALGAEDIASVPEMARRHRVMFLSEGIVFAVILLLGGVLFYAAMRREKRMEKNQQRLLAGTTHELKTPLATIRLGLESLQDERLPPERRARYLESMLSEADRLEAGLTNLLTAAGLRATGRVVRPQEGDLAADLRKAVSAIRNRSEAAGVSVRLTTPATAPAHRDAVAMQVILHNLLDNAVKYSTPDGVVDVRLDVEKGAALVAITDQGRGMSREDLAQAFEPFYRGTDEQTGGAGLGLHLVRELVLAHGGTVEAHSEGSGRGTQLRVRLPLDGTRQQGAKLQGASS